MRAIKTTIISILAVGLLAGSAVGVAAQDEESLGTAYFTGTVTPGTLRSDWVETVVDGILEGRDLVADETLDTSDPRLTGSMIRVGNQNTHRAGPGVVYAQTWRYRLENDAGWWVGQGTSLVHDGPTLSDDDRLDLETVVLTGAGAYEGLSAYYLADWTEDPITVKGAVFAGQMPPFPEAPPAE